MTPVKSSSIEAVAHDPAQHALTIRFRNGTLYRYDGVTADQHAALMRADSIGAHFAQHIRNQFPATKL